MNQVILKAAGILLSLLLLFGQPVFAQLKLINRPFSATANAVKSTAEISIYWKHKKDGSNDTTAMVARLVKKFDDSLNLLLKSTVTVANLTYSNNYFSQLKNKYYSLISLLCL